jgi:eukaryotic-like serine/threonine-protein kinase
VGGEFGRGSRGAGGGMNEAAIPPPPPPPPPAAEPRSYRKPLLWILLAVIAFGLGFLLTAVLVFWGRSDEVVTVPDLRWQPLAEAERAAAVLGLEVEVGHSLVNPQVPEGNILAQSPLPGEEVLPGSTVNVTLSAGAERRTIPDIGALGGEQARQLLIRYGFDVEVEERIDPATRAGQLLQVSPEPGSQIRLPATVRLVVSAGPPRLPMPDVLGLSEEQAREVLEEAGFRVGDVEYDFFLEGATGTVVGQVPAGSAQVPEGSTVRLVVVGVVPGDP